jgi:peptide/nickel transport system permease protein
MKILTVVVEPPSPKRASRRTAGGVLRSIYSKILRTKASKVGVAIVVGMFLAVLLGPFFVHYSPYTVNYAQENMPPTAAHPFGTDYRGRDILSQVIYGAYPSLIVGFLAATGAVLLGFFAGVIAGYYRKLEAPVSGATDVILSFPNLPLLIVIGSLFLVTNQLLIGALILVLWAPAARAVRAQVQTSKKLGYVEASKMSGMSDFQIVLRIIIPEVASIAIAYFILLLSVSIILITSLEFLGVGNPEIVSWGSILYWAQQYGFLFGDWWWVLAPGLSITLVATGFALIGFSFEEVLNPRLRV